MNKFWNYKLFGLVNSFAILCRVTYLLIYEKINSFFWKYNFKRAGNNLFVQKNSVIRFPGNISVGNSVNVGRNVEIFSESADSNLNISDNVAINKNVQIDFTGNLDIGSNVLISENSVILTHSHGLDPRSNARKIKKSIGKNVWIGQNSMILSNVRLIGENSIIGAGSIVTKDVLPNTIVAGNPAKLIKQINL
jgi:acetyltransferase-like isoleucine patch superfamily enzyme